MFNTNPNQDLNITHCVQFFYSSWGEFDHTPGLILNHSTPDALSCGLCLLLSKQGQHEGTHTYTHTGTQHHHPWMNMWVHTWIPITTTRCQSHTHTLEIHTRNRHCPNQPHLPVRLKSTSIRGNHVESLGVCVCGFFFPKNYVQLSPNGRHKDLQ